MKRLHIPLLLAVLAVGLSLPASVFASSYAVGVLSLDPSAGTIPGPGQLDILNATGAGSAPPDFPVTTTLTFGITSVLLDFSDGSTVTLTAADFASDGFGGFAGNNSFNTPGSGSGPFFTEAILTGTVSPTSATVSGVGPVTLSGSMTADLTDSSGGDLQLGDSAVIFASTGTATAPEPGTLLLLAAGLGSLALIGRKAALV